MKHFFLLAAVILALFACDDEPNCVDCINGGICIDGTCDCPEGFSGDSCQTERMPLTITISYMELTMYSDTSWNPVTNFWDEADSSDADVYFWITTPSMLTSFKSEVKPNVNPSTGVRWDMNLKLYNVTDYFYISFADEDLGAPADEVLTNPVGGGSTAMYLYKKGDGFPPELTVTSPVSNMEFKIGLTYDFN